MVKSVLFQDERCVFTGEQVCLSRTTGVLLRDGKSEGCAFTGAMKNKAFQERCAFPGQQVCFYGSNEGLLEACSQVSTLLQTRECLERNEASVEASDPQRLNNRAVETRKGLLH